MNVTRLLLSIGVMAGVTYLTRMLPLVLFRRKIQNVWVRSFLAYLPYAVLAAMTFPAVAFATGNLAASLLGLATALVLSWFRLGLFPVAAAATGVALVVLLVI